MVFSEEIITTSVASLAHSDEIEMAILVIRNSRKEMHNATRTPQQTHSSPEL